MPLQHVFDGIIPGSVEERAKLRELLREIPMDGDVFHAILRALDALDRDCMHVQNVKEKDDGVSVWWTDKWDDTIDPTDADLVKEKTKCTHGITFDEIAAESAHNLSINEIRSKWPRLYGKCPLGCGYNGIYYASMAHFLMGDW